LRKNDLEAEKHFCADRPVPVFSRQGLRQDAQKGEFVVKNGLRWILLSFWILSFAGLQQGQSIALAVDQSVVRAVLFYAPACGHCHIVITKTLPPLVERYGNQLQMVGVDISSQEGQSMYLSVLEKFNIERGGVPLLVVGDTYLMGSVDIPTKFPDMIEAYLAQGGVDWPAIPGFSEAFAKSEDNQSALEAGDGTVVSAEQMIANEAASQAPPPGSIVQDPRLQNNLTGQAAGSLTLRERFLLDPTGNSLAVIVLVGMVASVGGVAWRLWRMPLPPKGDPHQQRLSWLIPAICVLGLIVAGYLAYVETAHVDAVCGPVGDCNTVQQSAYARLFGWLPIGILGVLGYLGILLTWVIGRYTHKPISDAANLALFAIVFLGTLFSIYLTFLEPFVIGATCAWCLASAILMTALLWLTAPSARGASLSLTS
jgi:uncharacterized membrane protein/thiol-disulfide isomerase/thioredoxin